MENMTSAQTDRKFVGKSFATKMLCAYYSRCCDSRELFADLEISGDASFERNLNQYDVIYLDDYILLLRSLFKSSLTDQLFAGVYMTGILPIKKYGHESAVSDFYEYSMLEPRPLQEYIGFTAEEVKNLCRKYEKDYAVMQGVFPYQTWRLSRSLSGQLKMETAQS